MTYVAHDIGTIPAQGFTWYVIFFEGMFSSALRKEIDDNFLILGDKVGREILVIKGHDSEKFHESAYEAFEVHKPDWRVKVKAPCLLVTDTPPKAMEDAERLKSAKVMVFPLEDIYKERQSISGFLGELREALKDREAYEALDQVDPGKLQRKWGWLTNYFSMNPGFFGFGVKLDQIIDKFIFKRDPPKSFA